VFLLLLMLDNPSLMDPILEAWAKLGIRAAHGLESAACRVPQRPPARGPTGFLSFAHVLPASRTCSALLLAPVDSRAMAERAAAEVVRIAGPWEERRAAMLALPIASTWGSIYPTLDTATSADNDTEALPRELEQPLDES